MEPVTIILSTPEAVMFRDYQQFHDMFSLLVKQGVFDVKYGKVVLNFQGGELVAIEKNESVWHKSNPHL